MSVDVLISPRISFSHDLRETEHDSSVPIENYSSLHSAFDFDFAFIVDSHGSLIRESSTADQLFSDGKLLPISIDFAPNTEIIDTQHDSHPPVLTQFETVEKKKIVKSLKEHLEDSIDIEEEITDEQTKAEAVAPPLAIRAFWKSHRSNSLNRLNRAKLNIPSNLRLLSRSKSIGVGVGVGSLSTKPVREDEEAKAASPSIAARRSFWNIILLRSSSTGKVLEKSRIEKDHTHNHEEDKAEELGIRRSCSLNCNGHNYGRGLIMGRSNSTGSASTLKQTGSKKELQKQNSTKYPSGNAKASAWRKDKDKGQGRTSFKDYYGNSNRNERVNSVLNLPSPYISRVTVDFLGIGSLFCTSKSRKKNSK